MPPLLHVYKSAVVKSWSHLGEIHTRPSNKNGKLKVVILDYSCMHHIICFGAQKNRLIETSLF